jgi:hypothetical protein
VQDDVERAFKLDPAFFATACSSPTRAIASSNVPNMSFLSCISFRSHSPRRYGLKCIARHVM